MASTVATAKKELIRNFLRLLGHRLDWLNGFGRLGHPSRKSQYMQEVKKWFGGEWCIYCHDLNCKRLDHIVAMNQNQCGLDCWGNVGLACHTCDQVLKRGNVGYVQHIRNVCRMKGFSDQEAERHIQLIEGHRRNYKYNPDTDAIRALLKPLLNNIDVFIQQHNMDVTATLNLSLDKIAREPLEVISDLSSCIFPNIE